MMSLTSVSIPDGMMPVAAAMALIVLRDRDEQLTDPFRRLLTWWLQGTENLPAPMREMVQQTVAEAWATQPTRVEDPIEHWKRVPKLPSKGFHQISADMLASWPSRLAPPTFG
jgi:hypothetical protein